MTTAIRYALPAINHTWLTKEVLVEYPAHDKPGESTALVETLVLEYLKLWHLIIHYPKRRVVAPGPIAAVQRVHWKHRRQYFADCMKYFNRYLFKEMVWGGRLDVSGTFDTVRAYRDLYQSDPSPAWDDMLRAYNIERSHLRLL